ncbi:MAG: acyl-CoA dehydrogenase family protein, partial [Nitriliruptoraceae bacterium]
MDSSDLAALRDSIRTFCDAHVRPTARDRDRSEAFPAELLPGLVEIGVLGAVIPEEHGGAGLDAAGYRVVVEELGAADSLLRSLVSVNLGLVAGSIIPWGTPQQQSRLLPKLAQVHLGAFG